MKQKNSTFNPDVESISLVKHLRTGTSTEENGSQKISPGFQTKLTLTGENFPELCEREHRRLQEHQMRRLKLRQRTVNPSTQVKYSPVTRAKAYSTSMYSCCQSYLTCRGPRVNCQQRGLPALNTIILQENPVSTNFSDDEKFF